MAWFWASAWWKVVGFSRKIAEPGLTGRIGGRKMKLLEVPVWKRNALASPLKPESDSKEQNWLLKGYNNNQIADILGVTTRSVQNWRNKLKEHNNNITCLRRKHGSGQSPLLDKEQKQQLKQIIMEGARKAGYPAERWTSNIYRSPLNIGLP